MKYVLIGHRGVGKSELNTRIQYYLKNENYQFFDIDFEIEQRTKKKIIDIFSENGESYFRELEKQVFIELVQKVEGDIVLVTGAGFDVSVIPKDYCVIWVRRKTDDDGRVFLNRPRLNPITNPLKEFHLRAQQRTPQFKLRANQVYFMPEGEIAYHTRSQEIEKNILFGKFENVGGALSITPDYFNSELTWRTFIQRMRLKNIDFFELRDDLLSGEQIAKVISDLASENLILSLRSIEKIKSNYLTSPEFKAAAEKVKFIDWAIELGSPLQIIDKVHKDKLILSCHSDKWAQLVDYEHSVSFLKAAPLVENFSELKRLHSWFLQNPEKRNVMPWSHDGRWSWFRLYLKGKQKLNYWRESDGSATDQPTLFEWISAFPNTNQFTAVLGDPVIHSFSPIEHLEFFSKKQIPFYHIRILETEWEEAFKDLTTYGLKFAAITSPLKLLAAKSVFSNPNLESINTIKRNENGEWQGFTTDKIGLHALLEGINMITPLNNEIVVWGGGGMLPILKEVIPQSKLYSSRTGAPRDSKSEDTDFNPKILIWGAPRVPDMKNPPVQWTPQLVIDLSYKEDSVAREYALGVGAAYISGHKMFFEQARAQRQIWGND